MANRVIENITYWCFSKIFWVEPNLKNLKNTFNNNNVIVQFTPPKWLSPSEVWMIYYRTFMTSNINCMVYKWAHEWIVSLKDEWNWLKLKFFRHLNKSAPKYELSYWNTLIKIKRAYKINSLGNVYYEINDTNDFIFKQWLTTFQNELLDYCIDRWWLTKSQKSSYFNFKEFLFFIFIIIPVILVDFSNNTLCSIIGFIIYFLYILTLCFICMRKDEILCPWDIKLTAEWEKIFAEIYWYKYFLEHCEEEQLKKIIEEDVDFISETLPYAVALRLNINFLKYSTSCFSTSLFDADISELELNK